MAFFKELRAICLIIIGIALAKYLQVELSAPFLTNIVTLSLLIVMFFTTARYNRHEPQLKLYTLQTTLIMVSSVVILGFVISSLFATSLLYSAILGLLASNVLFGAMSLSLHKENKLLNALHVESVINSPLTLLAAFVLMDLTVSLELSFGILVKLAIFAKDIVIGAGTGLIVGLGMYKFMSRHFTMIKLVLVVASTFFSYILSQAMTGNGLIAVLVTAVVFGFFYRKEKEIIFEFFKSLTFIAELIIYCLLGFVAGLPWDHGFFARTVIIFAVLLIVRFAVLSIMQYKRFKVPDIVRFTVLPPISVVVAAIAILFITSTNMTVMSAGYILTAIVMYSTLVSAVSRLVTRM